MKISLVLMIFLSFYFNAAHAEGIFGPNSDTADKTDWSGVYIGGAASFDSGVLRFGVRDVPPIDYPYKPDLSSSAFVGYQFQNGPAVYGLELAYSPSGMFPAQATATYHTYLRDMKFKLGTVINQNLYYAIVGYSHSTVKDANVTDFHISGTSFGVGFQKQLSNNFFIGAEFLVRNMTGRATHNPIYYIDTSYNSILIRAGWVF